ncbi:hypothetical protein RB628_29200 [Streptomyces sp. ADMS]|uniref:hypothetical protein n=1 Tax=Streptomyces sp. ADMS TaxID=3071415 RepID=UPI00296E60A7|nr:hypothetical protein [Streptomyces sp. ADMS]MDW4909309.1 hypothetical protein [Streptomyces sp. ADMS]
MSGSQRDVHVRGARRGRTALSGSEGPDFTPRDHLTGAAGRTGADWSSGAWNTGTGTAPDQVERRQITVVLLETAPTMVSDLGSGGRPRVTGVCTGHPVDAPVRVSLEASFRGFFTRGES